MASEDPRPGWGLTPHRVSWLPGCILQLCIIPTPSPNLHVQAWHARDGVSKVIFFLPLQLPEPSSSSCSPCRTDNTGDFPRGAGKLIWSSWRHYLGVTPLSGSRFRLQGVSTSQVRKAGLAAARAGHPRGGYQPGHLLVWPSPIR